MGLNAVKMLGISITTSLKKEILEEVRKYLVKRQKAKGKRQKLRTKPFIIVTPNPEQVMLAQKDKHFAEILNQADVAIPDGIGLVAAMRLLAQTSDVRRQTSDVRRIPGVELMEDLVVLAAKQGYPVALIGARAGVAVEALECLQRKYPGLTGWAQDAPELEIENNDLRFMNYDSHTSYFINHKSEKSYFEEVLNRIIESGTRVIFVGLGAPKQEYFIAALQKALGDKRQVTSDKQDRKTSIHTSSHLSLISYHPLVFMAVGGSFDIIAGRTPRAPQAIQALGLEWLWRLVRQPWRLRRQLALLQFIWLVLRQKLFV